MYGLQSYDWDVWVKKQPQKQYQVPKISFNMRIKTGFKSTTFLTVQLLHRWYHQKPWKEGIPVQGRDHLMFLEDGVIKAVVVAKLKRKDQSCLFSGTTWLTLQTSLRPWSWPRQEIDELQKEFGEKLSSSQIQCVWIMESAVYQGKNQMPRTNRRTPQSLCKVLTIVKHPR